MITVELAEVSGTSSLEEGVCMASGYGGNILPTSHTEITNLLRIDVAGFDCLEDPDKRRLVAEKALVVWEKSVKELEKKVERKTKRTDGLVFEIYQLVALYSVFSGVVFTAVLESNRVECEHIWGPIVLCAFACAIIAFVTHSKFKEILSERSLIATDEEARKTAFGNLRKLRAFGHLQYDFRNPDHFKENVKRQPKRSFPTGPLAYIFVLVFVTLVLVVSFSHIVCIPKNPSCVHVC